MDISTLRQEGQELVREDSVELLPKKAMMITAPDAKELEAASWTPAIAVPNLPGERHQNFGILF